MYKHQVLGAIKADTIRSPLGRYFLSPPLPSVLQPPSSPPPPIPDHRCPWFPWLLFPVSVIASLVIFADSNLELPLPPVLQAVVFTWEANHQDRMMNGRRMLMAVPYIYILELLPYRVGYSNHLA